jgi:hypothetical protein
MADIPNIKEGEGKGHRDVVVVVTSPELVNQILDGQKSGMHTDRMAFNTGSDGFSVGDGPAPKLEAAQYAPYAAQYGRLPENGIGSREEVNDTLAFYSQKYPQNAGFNQEVQRTLSA